ncbi:hypothetical protein H257_07357 [Aphanomyces astaci]|uniref:Uncharacterized protein n=1 Tax=Aphanomyces astaci TaxID=112090 RepID=W4GK56_APHAT|nr:hypothetical protein H257_07357 [Aphanomyces astaci]ETV79308.1 hypothetical protein H257_07357 [Aphanomyces astaci]|eukprot:XP_009831149.1 hypothetical protein H257_07357 [Aphanomyces astaci]
MDLPAASKFGQKLAHTDKHVRDKAVKSLTQYLVKKKEWSDLDLDKIWKALFYCMWMSDKPKIQNELAENLSQLMHAFPDSSLKMRFLHSFFKTIHREWHGIDGLRLDKFYSLIRKILYQSFQFLQSEWDQAQVFSTHMSSEILSKLPNGLRLHLCDVYVQELFKSIGATVPSENLVMLLEPFFTLISTETDRIVTKRVNDMVFQVLLTEFQFQDTLKEVDAVATTDSEDNEDDNDPAAQAKVFGAAKLAEVQHRIFDLAAAAETQDRNRNILYSIYSALYAATKVDSAKKDRKRLASTEADGEGASSSSSKKKKRRKNKGTAAADVADPMVASPQKEVKEDASPTKSPQKSQKPQKKHDPSPQKPIKAVEPPSKDEQVPKKEEISLQKGARKGHLPTETKKATTKNVTADVAPKKGGKAPTTQKEQAAAYPRCTSCGGFGKGLVPVNKSMCGHCERRSKQEAKAKAVTDKKRKASSVVAETADVDASKKVRFGTNKALPYELSMKRMKKSVEKELVKPATGKGVLKVKEIVATATSNVKKNTTLNVKRARAADFF